jgi:hypothetical protein
MDTENNRQLAEVLGDLAVDMQSHKESDAVLRIIVAAAIHVVLGASWAGISRVSGRTVTAEVVSDSIVAELDQLQTELGEGPALSVLHDRHTVFIKDLTEETRWPNFVATATRLGVHCMLSFRLFVIGESLGALNLFGAAAGALTQDSAAVGKFSLNTLPSPWQAQQPKSRCKQPSPAATLSAKLKAFSCSATTSPGCKPSPRSLAPPRKPTSNWSTSPGGS